MRYLGSKEKIIPFIDEVISQCVDNIREKTFVDLFAGTTSVSRHFKRKGCKIISNDYLVFSYIFQIAYLSNNDYPDFSSLKRIGLSNYSGVIAYLNELPGAEGFFYKNYSLEGSQNYAILY